MPVAMVEMARRVRRIGRRILEVISPVGCLGCAGGLGDVQEDLCGDCWRELTEQVSKGYCDRCGFGVGPYHVRGSRCPSCRTRPFRFDGMVRVGAHEGLLRSMVNSYKFGKRPDGVRVLGDLLSSATAGAPGWADVDALVPIPMHRRKLLTAGESAVLVLAKFVGRHLDVPVAAVLRVAKPGPPQRGLSATQRWENIRGRFGLSRGADLAGASVCLIDDVSTTGATLNEAAKVLKNAGAARVVAAVVTKRDPAYAKSAE